MTPGRTDSELVAAIEAMYRIRAVESPPDDSGRRTIWHRASKNAELVTWVDAEGRVLRQELMLFDDIVIWERGAGVKTGTVVEGNFRTQRPSDSMTLDDVVDQTRLTRMTRGLAAYGGADRFIAHVRELIKPPELLALGFEQQITRPSHQVIKAMKDGQSPGPKKAPPTALLIGVGLLLVAVALMLIFWK